MDYGNGNRAKAGAPLSRVVVTEKLERRDAAPGLGPEQPGVSRVVVTKNGALDAAPSLGPDLAAGRGKRSTAR
jgi:hypothetical protein